MGVFFNEFCDFRSSSDVNTNGPTDRTGPELLLKELNEKFESNNLLLVPTFATEQSINLVPLKDDTYKDVQFIEFPIKL